MTTKQSSRIDPAFFENQFYLGDEGVLEPVVDAAVRRAIGRLSRFRPVAEPFRHVVADNLFDRLLLREVAEEFPPADSPLWFCYDSPLEKKLCCNRIDLLDPVVSAFVRCLNTVEVAALVGKVMGIPELVVDPSLHGAGLHLIEPGGKLDLHLDFADHPKLPLRRRVNLVLYLNEYWLDAWGGALELWDAEVSQCAVQIAPRFNRLVLFEVHDKAFHGHPDPLACPPGCCRRSIALYFLTPRQKAPVNHPRARFVARPNDPPDLAIEALRRERANLDSIR
jgi:hypothetical protein